MKKSVAAAFWPFTDRFEGRVDFMYLDEGDSRNPNVLGRVTTGRGNLIDPVSAALALPWERTDGSSASLDEISAEWLRIKTLQAFRKQGGMVYAKFATLRLSPAAIDALCNEKLASMESKLRGRFPAYDTWPADAQLALLSMSWAMGPAFNFPKFAEAALTSNFMVCAAECHMSNGAPARNSANQRCFENAARVEVLGMDPEVLHYPAQVAA